MPKQKRSDHTKPTPATSTPEAGLFASMSSKNHIANSTPDDWRHALAWRVRELVSTPERMGIFRDRLKDWFKEELSQFYETSDLDTNRVSLPLPLKDCEPTLGEKFAILAALHDVALSQSGVDPVVIVDLQSSTSGAKLSEQKVGAINFIQLFKQIPKMPKRYQPALEKYLADVRADLEASTPATVSQRPTGEDEPEESGTAPNATLLSVRDWASIHGLTDKQESALAARLRRKRMVDPEGNWLAEVTLPKRGEARYAYHGKVVLPMIEELKRKRVGAS